MLLFSLVAALGLASGGTRLAHGLQLFDAWTRDLTELALTALVVVTFLVLTRGQIRSRPARRLLYLGAACAMLNRGLDLTDEIAAFDAVPLLGDHSVMHSASRRILTGGAVASLLASLCLLVRDSARSERESAHNAMMLLARGTAGAVGPTFFASLAENLGRTLGVSHVVVAARLDASRETGFRTLAFWTDGGLKDNFELGVDGAPCEQVYAGNPVFFASGVRAHFPHHAVLAELGAESYCGIPLKSVRGDVIGHIGIVDRKAMAADPGQMPAVQIFAARAAAELERARREDELQHAAKLESLGLMAGGIAHDFNNLLTVVIGEATVARVTAGAASPVGPHLEAIENAGLRASELCRQLTTYAGEAPHDPEPLSLSALVADMHDLLQLSVPSRSVRFELDPAVPAIVADRTQLRQVILNLVGNAGEAVGDRGEVRVRTGVLDTPRLTPAAGRFCVDVAAGPYAYVSVEDDGAGIDPESIPKVFDPFYSTKSSGRGLGLAVVFGIVCHHRGAIEVESRRGVGSTFRVLLGIAPDAARLEDEIPAAPLTAPGTGTVLVVDDAPSVLLTARSMLEQLGYDVLTADGGRAALRVFADRRAEIDVVLLDFAMPGMNGDQALAGLRDIDPSARVILMSGYDEPHVRRCVSDARITAFLTKPFLPDDLASSLRLARVR